MSIIKARLVNPNGYFLEVKKDGTVTSNVGGDNLNGILEFQSVNFDGIMTIKGIESGLYIYGKPDGSLGTTKTNNKATNSLSWKQQQIKFSTFLSVSTGKYLSSKNGKVKTVKKSSAQVGQSEMWLLQPVI